MKSQRISFSSIAAISLKQATKQAMHLSRETRRFEMKDLSSRRGDRRRYLAQISPE